MMQVCLKMGWAPISKHHIFPYVLCVHPGKSNLGIIYYWYGSILDKSACIIHIFCWYIPTGHYFIIVYHPWMRKRPDGHHGDRRQNFGILTTTSQLHPSPRGRTTLLGLGAERWPRSFPSLSVTILTRDWYTFPV